MCDTCCVPRIEIASAHLMQAHLEELAALDCIDAGKPVTGCLSTDLPAALETFRWYAEAIDKCHGRVAPTGPEAMGLIVKEPIGVVGTVLPWNFPAQMYAWKVAPALAAGNSMIVKPAELTSLSAYRMTQAWMTVWWIMCCRPPSGTWVKIAAVIPALSFKRASGTQHQKQKRQPRRVGASA